MRNLEVFTEVEDLVKDLCMNEVITLKDDDETAELSWQIYRLLRNKRSKNWEEVK